MGCLRCEVKACLDALCEGRGLTEADDGDFEVDLGELTISVRCIERCRAVTVFGVVYPDLSVHAELDLAIHRFNQCHFNYRAFLEDGALVLRGDYSAAPFDGRHLAAGLAEFELHFDELARAVPDVL
jgi:hypothetical protein